MSTERKSHNYGRFDWRMPYPKTRDEIRLADDDQIVRWWRFLSPAPTKEKSYMLSDITYEFNKRFKNKENQTQTT